MIGRWLGWVALTAGIVGCTTHFVQSQSDMVVLYLKRPQAGQVMLACSIDGFTPRPARRLQNDLWEAVVEPNNEFRYFYIIDGTVYVPDCRFQEADGWGGKNCIYIPRM